ncbi:protein of unknown function [Bradyrhizobium shewense]|uniref:PPC domain-containing protein n=1 Tax=Bradyrhizobium shewense TaxID=1761772 RepID=A0A1C3XVB5_9BRAD|nr:DUF296 domain-containing protein [Bradyrhizobium shewense]SCB56165.1 protein of unknown function [Bradyrhizobium shewense]
MKRKRQGFGGKIEQIYYVRLEAGEDFLPALWDICEEYDIQTGILMSASGSMSKVRLMRISNEPRKDNWGVDFVEIPGPLQMITHGLIGKGWVPDNLPPTPEFLRGYADTGFGAAGFEGHGTPYARIYATVTGVSGTVCGHLLQGSPIGGINWDGRTSVPSHWSVAIAKVSGVVLKCTYDKTGLYHDIVPA